MRRSWRDRYRVDNVPWSIRPFYLALTEALGAGIAAYFYLIRKTSKVVFEGDDAYLRGRIRAIECTWHENVLVHASLGLDWRGHQWINHPAWYMRPIHVAARWLGVTMILGSSGHGGQRAADEVVETIKRGHGSVMYPDGPEGPRREPKLGACRIAIRAGVPLVAIVPIPSRSFRLRSWDRKVVPLPFGTIRVIVSEPHMPVEGQLDASKRWLCAALGGSYDSEDRPR